MFGHLKPAQYAYFISSVSGKKLIQANQKAVTNGTGRRFCSVPEIIRPVYASQVAAKPITDSVQSFITTESEFIPADFGQANAAIVWLAES